MAVFQFMTVVFECHMFFIIDCCIHFFLMNHVYSLNTFAQINSDGHFNVISFTFESFSTVRNPMNVGSTAGLSDPLPGFPAAVKSFRFRSLFKIFFLKKGNKKKHTGIEAATLPWCV